MNERFKRLAQDLVALLVILIAFEFVLWVFDVAPPRVEKERDDKIHRVDPETFHAKMSSDTPGGSLTCLGGSTVAGSPFDYEMSACTLVGDAMGRETKVHNLAGAGMDSTDLLMLAEMVCKHPQDLILIYTGHNEFLNLQRHVKHVPEAVSALAELFMSFRSYRLINGLFSSQPERIADIEAPDLSDKQVYKIFERNMEQLIRHCKDQPLVFATVISNEDFRFPLPGWTIREGYRKAGHSERRDNNSTCRHCFRAGPEVNKVITRLGRKHDVPVVRTEKLIAGKDHSKLFWDHVHPKPALHEEMALAILTKAQSKGLLKEFRKPKHNLTPERIEWAKKNRALYNVQFDPAIAIEQLRDVEKNNKTIMNAVVIAVCAFLLDDTALLDSSLKEAAQMLAANDGEKRRWSTCVGLDGGRPERGSGGGPACQLSCMPWCSQTLMNDREQNELSEIVKAVGNPVLERLMKEF